MQASCLNFWENLIAELGEAYSPMASCNKDISAYLVPNGTEGEVTYQSKPENSFRISDYWNWYANTKKCPDPNYVQCCNKSLPYPHSRPAEGLPSKPIKAICVACFHNGHYQTIYGEYYDQKTRKWGWREIAASEFVKKWRKENEV